MNVSNIEIVAQSPILILWLSGPHMDHHMMIWGGLETPLDNPLMDYIRSVERAALVQTPINNNQSDAYDHEAMMPIWMGSTPTDTAMDHNDVSNRTPT